MVALKRKMMLLALLFTVSVAKLNALCLDSTVFVRSARIMLVVDSAGVECFTAGEFDCDSAYAGSVEAFLNVETKELVVCFCCGFASVGMNLYKGNKLVRSFLSDPKPGDKMKYELGNLGAGDYTLVIDTLEEENNLWCKFRI